MQYVNFECLHMWCYLVLPGKTAMKMMLSRTAYLENHDLLTSLVQVLLVT